MKAKELIILIASRLPEEQILAQLKVKLAKIASLSKMKPWNNRTPLESATARGYTSIVRFLVEEKGANPKEQNREKIPLDFAIANNKTETAVYLISKMKGFDIERYALCLLFAIKVQQTITVKAILEAAPQILQYCTVELLEEAIAVSPDEITLLLLQYGANTMILAPGLKSYSPYYLALKLAKHQIIAAMLEAGASQMQSFSLETKTPVVFAKGDLVSKVNKEKYISDLNLTPLQIVANSSVSNANKRGSANVLLAAGAGLDIRTIPSEIFTLYNQNRNNPELGEFLLIVEQRQNDNTWKKKLISQVAEVKERIDDPNWRFNKIQLLRSCTYLASRHLPHIEELRNILSRECTHSAVLIPTNVQAVSAQTSSHFVPRKNVTFLNVTDLRPYLHKCYQQFIQQKELLFKSLDEVMTGNIHINITIDFNNTFMAYSHLIEIMKHKYGNNFAVSPNAMLESTLITEFHLIEEKVTVYLTTLLLIKTNPHLNQIFLNINSAFNEQCKFILKKHKSFLSQTDHHALYDDLHEAKAVSDLNLAQQYYYLNNSSLALYYLISAQHSLRQRKVFKEVKPIDYAKNQLTIYVWMTAVYHRQGCYREATLELHKVNTIVKNHPQLVSNSVQLLLITIGRHIEVELVTQESLVLYQEVNQHFSLYQENVITDDIKSSFELFNHMLSSMKKIYLNEARNAFIDKLSIAGFLMDAHGSETIHLFLTPEERTNLSIDAMKLLTETLGVLYNPDSDRIDFNNLFLLKNDYQQWLKSFIAVMVNKPTAPTNNCLEQPGKQKEKDETDEVLMVAEKLSYFTFSKPKEKIKTRPSGNTEGVGTEDTKLATNKQSSIKRGSQEKLEEKPIVDKYGFKQLAGYSPAIPVVSNFVPNETLFLAIPNNDPTFLPFLNLSYDKNTDSYREIRSIAEKGFNQQGVKLGSKWLHNVNQPSFQIDIARVKVLGADGKGKLRATGQVQQQVEASDKRLRKLYVIDNVTDKKKEKRKKSLN